MAVAPFGRGREREQRGNRDGGRARGVPGRVRERPGVSWRLQAHRGGRQPGRRWPSATAVLATELLRALAREEDRRRGGQVGWAAGGAGPGKWRQVGGPGGLLSLSLFLFTVFYFCSVLFNWH